jgi:hypothetical protein
MMRVDPHRLGLIACIRGDARPEPMLWSRLVVTVLTFTLAAAPRSVFP